MRPPRQVTTLAAILVALCGAAFSAQTGIAINDPATVPPEVREKLQSIHPDYEALKPKRGSASLAGAAMAARVLYEARAQRMSDEQFAAWVDAKGVTLEILARTLDGIPMTFGMEPTYRPICAAIWKRTGEDLKPSMSFPPRGRLVMAIYLGLLEREDDVKALVSSVPRAELDAIPDIPVYGVASELYLQRKSLRTAIWAWKREAAQREAYQRAQVCFQIRLCCELLNDPAVAREDLIPWAEEALAQSGSEEMWGNALPSLVWAYDFVGEPQKALERGQYWLDQAKARNLPVDRVQVPTKVEMAVAQVSAGQYEEAKQALHEYLQQDPEWAADRVYQALTEAKQEHPEIGEIEPLPPRCRGSARMGGSAIKVAVGEKVSMRWPVYGNVTFEIKSATCDLPFVEVTVGERKLDRRTVTYQLQITATGAADKVGTHQGTITLTTNDADQTEVRLPIMVEVRTP